MYFRFGRSRVAIALAAAATVTGAGASVALGAGSSSAPAGGPIHVFVQPGQGQGNGKILITGAIGDYGATHKASSSGGKTLATAALKKGTITFDLTTITAKVNNASPTFDKATCSGSITESAPVSVASGTGLYAGVHGTVRLTESFGFIGSTYKSGSKKGQCNLSKSAPTVAQMGEVYGSGTISF
ncbi:MAG: hypothetical protein JO095_03525 [Alphaproteobacteria bacterium]|nr:hypothetical protein [Alphaproteobacteria bacterium]